MLKIHQIRFLICDDIVKIRDKKSDYMNIESYEPFHVGIKLANTISLPAFRKRLLTGMKQQGFTIVADDEYDADNKTETIAKNNNAKIEFNYPLFALNTVGSNPKQVAEEFEKLMKLLISLDYELENALVVFYDVFSNVVIHLDEDPAKLIDNSVKCNLDPWKEINSNAHIAALRIDVADLEYGKGQMTMTIGPNPVRPKTSLVLGFRSQQLEKDKVIEFCNKIDGRILTFISSLGGKN